MWYYIAYWKLCLGTCHTCDVICHVCWLKIIHYSHLSDKAGGYECFSLFVRALLLPRRLLNKKGRGWRLDSQREPKTAAATHWPGLRGGLWEAISPSWEQRKTDPCLGSPEKGSVVEYQAKDQEWSKCWANVFKPSHSKMTLQLSRIQDSSSTWYAKHHIW